MPITAALHIIMKLLLTLIIVISATPAFGCEKIYGRYKSVSETHWNFQLEISKNNVFLLHTDYFYGDKDLRTDQTIESEGHCEKTETGYRLTFAQMSVNIKYHEALSRASFGDDGASPGVTGEFIPGKVVELWQGM